MMNRLIALTGGIGAGKSVVAGILRTMGYPVYDCDDEARRLMDSSLEIKLLIKNLIGERCVDCSMNLNRPAISEIVFHDSEKLSQLNGIVHHHVREDIIRWQHSHSNGQLLFVETAILYQSGIDKLVDAVIDVTASESIRISRVMARNNVTAEHAKARIDAQKNDISERHKFTFTIVNDGTAAILPQIEDIISSLKSHFNGHRRIR